MNINIAVVEDDDVYAEVLKDYLIRLEGELQKTLPVTRYNTASAFLEEYRFQYSLVLMDIEMPGLDGMTAAKQLRERDLEIVIIFITNMKQYAISGYEVQALDFIVKPIRYKDFALKIGRAVRKCSNMAEQQILIPVFKSFRRVSTRKLMYVEVMNHELIYHLSDETISTRATLKSAEQILLNAGFLRCNNCYMVNPRFIESVEGSQIRMGNDTLKISKPRRKQFMKSWADWLAGATSRVTL